MSAANFTDDGGGALTFDGTDEYVAIPHDSSIDFGSGSFTVFLWVKFDQLIYDMEIWLSHRAHNQGV